LISGDFMRTAKSRFIPLPVARFRLD